MLTAGVADGLARIAPAVIACIGAGCLIVIVLGLADVYLTGHRLGPIGDRAAENASPPARTCCEQACGHTRPSDLNLT